VRLCSFSVPLAVGAPTRLGAVVGEEVVDLAAATAARLAARGLPVGSARRLADALTPSDVVCFIEAGAVALEAAGDTLAWVEATGAAGDVDGCPLRQPLVGLRYLPAVPNPPLLRDFMAFEEHLLNIYPRLGREIPPEWYELPVYYKANPASVGAHEQVVAIPSYADELDVELELAAVIGPGGSDIPAEHAGEHIFGYTIYNDLSARAIQSREMAVGLGPAKGKDFRGGHVLGPWIVTADELGAPDDLAVTLSVNGQRWTRATTARMHWRFADMLAHASRDETVRTGEVFGSGTVGGGSGTELGRSLHPGDVVEIEVDRIGTLVTRIAPPPGAGDAPPRPAR